jgi:hypothetical protein
MRRALTVAALLIAAAVPAVAHWGNPTGLPVHRLLKNLAMYRAEHPDDVTARFMIARVHTYAFVFGSRMAPCWLVLDQSEPTQALDLVQTEAWHRGVEPRDRESIAKAAKTGKLDAQQEVKREHYEEVDAMGSFTETELALHLETALRGFIDLLERDKTQAEFHLGFAYLLEQASPRCTLLEHDPLIKVSEVDQAAIHRAEALAASVEAGEIESAAALATAEPSVLAALRDMAASPGSARARLVAQARAAAWLERAEVEYRAAFDMTADRDASGTRPIGPGGLRDSVSFEAALGLVRLLDGREAREGDAALRARAMAQMKTIEDLPLPNWVTPIIFGLAQPASLDQLLAPDRIVEFDLDGSGPRAWPWLQQDTAMLVWDPEQTGSITSGLQLFGSVTWWLFFENGYRAMDLLDDDRDGWLQGDELAELGAWRDSNQNGVSESGEVLPLARLGIAALATHATGASGRSPMNARGLRLDDGRVLPTYDWVIAPAVDP